jgi:hypothetical protein
MGFPEARKPASATNIRWGFQDVMVPLQQISCRELSKINPWKSGLNQPLICLQVGHARQSTGGTKGQVGGEELFYFLNHEVALSAIRVLVWVKINPFFRFASAEPVLPAYFQHVFSMHFP